MSLHRCAEPARCPARVLSSEEEAATRAAKKAAEKTGNPAQRAKKIAAKTNEKVKSAAQRVKQAFTGKPSCDKPNSFVPGTPVVMADGSTKPIEKVQNGDKVLATDPETGETTSEVVTAEIEGEGGKHLVKVTIDTDGDRGGKTASVTATDSHPFWVEAVGAWVDATDLEIGEWLRTSAGAYVQITAIERWTASDATVHNLTVNDLHTYYVLAGKTPVLVHNSNGKGCEVGGSGISARNENAGDIGNYTDGQKTRDPASQWYHEMLSNDELLGGINKAGEGDGILVSRDGTILGGHHRKDELLARIRDGRIDPNTKIRIDVYDGD